MKKLTITITGCFLVSCTVNKSNFKEELTVQNFKDRTLQKCLLKGYENKDLVNRIYDIDKTLYDPVAIALFDDEIDAFLVSKINKMKKDSMESIGKVSEAKAGKIVFGNCLYVYKSKELDNFATKHINKYKKVKDLDSLILSKNPSF
ncbi:hypothetical protein DBR39_20095 [Chryseobacterium sp. KBW03]|uniref:hypothetical protein n=1 Tax=Chryseobacterium sp. KBW03 TaxID=2153362 RepID=UPI000F5B2EBD|nr:hypothetical protein [Chryseobacterium sp. KBW03]RQO35260.1 hypothetical protein DBR39_20095 [Chryseobacterium sp. KBW03]